jgi:phytoene synthase
MTDIGSKARADLEVVWAAAREHDRDRYLAALLAPRGVRDDLVVLTAYLGDVARIPLTVSEPELGRIRLQWWRDAITMAKADTHTGNPMADALMALARRKALTPNMLLAPLEARERELEPLVVDDGAVFLAHLDDAEGAGLRLAAAILDVGPSPDVDTCLTHAGRAFGAVRLALNLPLLMSRGRFPILPQSANMQEGMGEAGAREVARNAVDRFATIARQSLSAARRAPSPVIGALAPALCPLALVEPYLRVLQTPGRDLLREPAEMLPLRRIVYLWLARWKGQF